MLAPTNTLRLIGSTRSNFPVLMHSALCQSVIDGITIHHCLSDGGTWLCVVFGSHTFVFFTEKRYNVGFCRF